MNTKVCIGCKVELPVEKFYVRKDTGGTTSECRDCKKSRASAYFYANRDRHHATVKRRYAVFGRFNRYGLTEENYRDMLASQNGVCALCSALEPGGKGKWHIDHVHTGVDPKHVFKQCDKEHVRGLLCHRCNISLGHYEKLKENVGEEFILNYLGLTTKLE